MSDKNGIPDQAEFGELTAYLMRVGASRQQVAAILGDSPSGRTRAEIAELLRLWMKGLPKDNAVRFPQAAPLVGGRTASTHVIPMIRSAWKKVKDAYKNVRESL